MRLRRYRAQDLPALAQLFYDTVHTVNARDYDEGQLNAWAPGEIDEPRWRVREGAVAVSAAFCW